MGRKKKVLDYDNDGIKKVMRKRDYIADLSGQFGLALMANLIGQLTYFYTDKVGLAVGGVGIAMAIAKILDAFTDIWFGNVIDHSKGGNRKYYRWMIRMSIPAAAIVFFIFTVPTNSGQVPALIYVLITNILFSAVVFTMISTPFAAVMAVRTNSQLERGNMGIMRAAGSYGAGMIIAIATIPVTNLLGGNQSAWIKYGAVLALIVLLSLLICYKNGHKAEFAGDKDDEQNNTLETPVPFNEAIRMLFKNKYWIMVLLFNLITQITNTIVVSANAYYSKWIFGNDNLVGIMGAFGLVATFLGFIFSKPIITKLGIRRTIEFGLLGAAGAALVHCIIPTNFVVYLIFSLIGSFVQIPLMCLYGVLVAMTIDYNEWKFGKKLVAISSGAIGFGSKVGGGIGSVLLSAFLVIGAYDATLKIASTSMRYAIYGFSNYLPLVINVGLFFVFHKFDLEERLPAMRDEIAKRKSEIDL